VGGKKRGTEKKRRKDRGGFIKPVRKIPSAYGGGKKKKARRAQESKMLREDKKRF